MIYKYLTLAVSAALLLAGCDEKWNNAPGQPGQEIRLNAEIQAMTKVSEMAFDEADRIGVFVTEYDGDFATELAVSGNYADNRLFTYTGNALTTEEGLYYPVINNVDIYGYHPYRETVESVTAFPFRVATDQREEAALKGSDFVWAKRANVAANSSVVDLGFSHLLSTVEVRVDAGNGISSLEGMTVTLRNVACEGTIDLRTGQTAVSDTVQRVDVQMLQTNVEDSWQQFRAIVFPQTISGGTYLVEISLDGKKYTYQVPEGGQIFGSGKWQFYQFVLNAYQKELQLKSASVSNWISNGDQITEEILPDIDGREALLALYEAAGGENWTRRDNWGTNTEISTWYGVTVEDNEVTGIDLSANNLSGTLPKELGALIRLKRLVLNDNLLTDTIPASIGHISTLEELNLANNSLIGKIPASLGDLRNLEVFDLSHNYLSGSIPRRVTLLSAYDLDKVGLQYNAEGAEIYLEIEGAELTEGEQYIGDLNFANQAEINSFAEKGYAEVLGNMTINTNNTDITNVPVFKGLQKIHGNLEGYNNTSFPDLTYVGGNLTGSDEYWTAENTDKLTYVGGDMEITGKDIAGFNTLEEVYSLFLGLGVYHNSATFAAVNGFRNLIKVKEDVLLSESSVQGFGNLAEVGGVLTMNYLMAFPEFSNLKTCGGIEMDECGKEGMVYNGFNALETSTGNLDFYQLNLSEFRGFESFRNIQGYIRFNGGDYLTVIPEFPALEEIVSTDIRISGLSISGGPLLTKVTGFNNLVSAHAISISGEALQEINGFNNLIESDGGTYLSDIDLSGNALTRIVGFENYTSGGIDIDAPLTEIPEFKNYMTGNVSLENTYLTDISGFNVWMNGDIYLRNNSKLEHISGFNALKGTYKREGFSDVRKTDITLASNVLLKDITGFAALDTLGQLSITGCYSLETLPLADRLQYLSTLRVENNYSLTTIPVFQPTVLLDELTVTGNTVLEDYTNFQAVIDENTDVTISNNKYNPTKEDILSGAVKPEE